MSEDPMEEEYEAPEAALDVDARFEKRLLEDFLL